MNRRNTLATLTAIAGLTSGIAVMFTGAAGAVNTSPVTVMNGASNPVPVNGTVNIGNLPATQQVGGTVNVGNLPATQQVGGTVNVGNLPDDQQVHGNVKIDNLPADQQVHGNVDVREPTAYRGSIHGTGSSGSILAADDTAVPQTAYDLDTISVRVLVPAGDHAAVQARCSAEHLVQIPVTFQLRQYGYDTYSGTVTQLGAACDSGYAPQISVYYDDVAAGTATLEATLFGHLRS